jgi:dipeptidyl-peptidase-4
MSAEASDTFPRQHARTRRFTLGHPRTFTVAPDGSRVVFLRSRSGGDPITCLWVLDVGTGIERLVYDPAGPEEEDLPPEERARRERNREAAGGVVAYATDREVSRAVFTVGGRMFLADLADPAEGRTRELPAEGPVFDPRLDPSGRRVAYVAGRALRVLELDGEDRVLASEDDPDVSWGLAEFVAAEEMDRTEGFWWSPDGTRIAAARVDERDVPTWHLFDAVEPDSPPRAVRYPAAGTTNADVRLFLLGLEGSRTEVRWDRERFDYLARVEWSETGELAVVVQTRDQRVVQVLAVRDDGATTLLREDRDDAWIELVEGSPAWTRDGRLVCTEDSEDTRRLVVAGEVVTPPGLQVRHILDVSDAVLFVASEDPTQEHVWRWSPGGGLEPLTRTPGVHTAAAAGDIVVVTSATPVGPPWTTVMRGDQRLTELASVAEEPLVDAQPRFFPAGARELRSALLLPGGREPEAPLPVLLDPYGGPKVTRVVRARDAFLSSQWLADQGFAVLVTDGRGTPGRGPGWEREIYRNVVDPVLEDQVDALHAAAERFGFLDLSRVAIRGWSFGGELAAAAVLHHPEIFRAAVVGAPVTDQRLYDTHYNERYFGHPDEEPEVYRRNSVLVEAAKLERPLLLIHGLADDNCYVAHSLRFSQALTEAGRPHMFLPLPGMTHRPLDETIAENLLLLQLRFLRESLGVPTE